MLPIIKNNERRKQINEVKRKQPINSLNKLRRKRIIEREERLDYH